MKLMKTSPIGEINLIFFQEVIDLLQDDRDDPAEAEEGRAAQQRVVGKVHAVKVQEGGLDIAPGQAAQADLPVYTPS